jgi:hypothetical protein
MSNHTGPARVCQSSPDPDARETTPSSLPALDGIDRRLVVRYGAWLLVGGYTALPTYAWVYYARLGVTEAEMVLIAQLCTYWWDARDPYPGEAALAARMGKTVRTIQGYLRSLEGKGLLHIQTRLSTHGQQHTNAYDLRPFFVAVEGLARLDGLLPADDATSARSSPAVVPLGEQRPLCADQPAEGERGKGSRAGGVKDPSPQVNPVEIDNFDLDSMPPTPVNASSGPTTSNDRNDQALATEIAALSVELGDDAPRSSLGRVRNLHRDASVSLDRFLRLLDEAAARTRERQASIVKRRRDSSQVTNGMPYLFAVLQDLLHPAPPRPAGVGPDADRRRSGPPGRRRRRRDSGRGEPVNSYAAWSDSPAPVPIVEEHPVWRAVLDELAQVMTAENFNIWLATTRALDQDGEVLRVAVPAAFNKTWLEQKLAGKVMGALQKIDYAALHAEHVAHVEYVVEAAACAPADATAQAS